MRDTIHRLIQIFVHRIPLNQPFMLRNVTTNGYLSWRTNPKQHLQQQQQQQQHLATTNRAHDSGYDNSTSTQSATHNNNIDHQQIASTLFSTLSLDMMKTTNSFCIWNFSDNSVSPGASSSRQTPFSTKATPRKYVRCGSQLYLKPSMPSSINKDIILTRSTSASSATSSSSSVSTTDNPLQPRVWDLYVEKASRVRSVEFLEKYALAQEASSRHQWTVETPDLGLDMDDDFSTDGHLNVDIAIGRQKPILNQEIISLRQILYLCSVHSQISYSPSTQQRRSVNNASHSPPIVIPSPVPPGAAGVMAMLRKISSDNADDDFTFSHPSTSVARSHSKRKSNTTTAPINNTSSSSSSTLHLNSAASNNSAITLPYYNLHTYTVLPPPLVTASTVSVSLSPTLTYPSSLSASPSQHNFNPVLAKEHSLISGPEESYWVIELLPNGSGDPTDLGRDVGGMNTNSKSNSIVFDTPSLSNKPLDQDKQKHIGPAISHSFISNTTENWQHNTTGPMRLKMVMSSDTLRDDAMSAMTSSPTQHGSHSTMRRVQSYSSVHDAHYIHQQHQQQQQQYECQQHHVSLPGIDGQEDNNMGINRISTTREEFVQSQQPPLSPMVSSSSPLSPIPQQYTAAPNIQPYLRLYAAKQNNKTWSHFIKHSTLANLKRWLKTE
ncbi:hypothetical protein BCR42DRAFT_141967 [Absidia repens]|uniref:Uncharacterized protein n=1 Tax=Absidia repens TaxID=90262 RepID=A0A1X2I3R1_9FUNG|nr:hypothetical protein BCR42DRAFT_141967 [Absidia repens]